MVSDYDIRHLITASWLSDCRSARQTAGQHSVRDGTNYPAAGNCRARPLDQRLPFSVISGAGWGPIGWKKVHD